MKHLKKYENENNPKIGDFVICNDENYKNDLDNFISTNIGQIVDINKYKYYSYIVKYDKIPGDYYEAFSHSDYINSIDFKRDQIIYFSENKEDLEAILNAKKYNI